MSPLSKRVVQAGMAGIQLKTVPSSITPEQFFTGVDDIRRLFANLINAPTADRIAIIPSASYGIAITARNTPVRRGQNIVVTRHQFPSNAYAWRMVSERDRVEVRSIEAPAVDHGRAAEWNARLLEAIDTKTAIVALGQVHWTDGTWFDLEAIGRRAREVGAAFVVDGTQSVGAMPFDLQAIQPDALICAGYKWLMGPYSIGAAYFGPRYSEGIPLEETWISRVGSEDFRGLVDYVNTYRPGAARFDVGGGSNFILVPMLIAALSQVCEWGVSEIESYCRGLTSTLVVKAREMGIGIEGEEWRCGHILGLRLPPELDLVQVHGALAARNVNVSMRGEILRVSPHVYNDEADIDALAAALEEVAPRPAIQ